MRCAHATGALALSPGAISALEGLIRRPLAEAGSVTLTSRAAREVLAVVTGSYEYHGGFRLRTLSA